MIERTGSGARWARLVAGFFGVLVVSGSPAAGPSPPMDRMSADALVQELRELPPYIDPGPMSHLCPERGPCPPPPPPPAEVKRRRILELLHDMGRAAVPALARALERSDLNLKRNVTLALGALADGSWVWERAPAKVDIRAALPALIGALHDRDAMVRARAADAIGDIGPGAAAAVPALIPLLRPREEARAMACLALSRIGPPAHSALPALMPLLSDPDPYVAKLARMAVASIGGAAI
jgi:hypothetical protein